jgi:thiamine-phosphate pyrophosphorylase
VLRYAITDRAAYGGSPAYRLDFVVREATRWAAEGIDFIQIREKDLGAGELAGLTRRVVAAVRAAGAATRVLVNSRADVAVAAGADGVHLTAAAGQLLPLQVRSIYAAAGRSNPVVSTSCHTVEEVQRASALGVDAILFGPVFGKTVSGTQVLKGLGLESLREACEVAGGTPVYALGGVTEERAAECLVTGATGVAGIRFFRTLIRKEATIVTGSSSVSALEDINDVEFP